MDIKNFKKHIWIMGTSRAGMTSFVLFQPIFEKEKNLNWEGFFTSEDAKEFFKILKEENKKEKG